jgi:hypothetical protein
MQSRTAGTDAEPTVVYRVEIEGRLSPEVGHRLGAHGMACGDRDTILEIRVMDQSALLGRLRRIHDLNLRLVAVARTDMEQ